MDGYLEDSFLDDLGVVHEAAQLLAFIDTYEHPAAPEGSRESPPAQHFYPTQGARSEAGSGRSSDS